MSAIKLLREALQIVGDRAAGGRMVTPQEQAFDLAKRIRDYLETGGWIPAPIEPSYGLQDDPHLVSSRCDTIHKPRADGKWFALTLPPLPEDK